MTLSWEIKQALSFCRQVIPISLVILSVNLTQVCLSPLCWRHLFKKNRRLHISYISINFSSLFYLIFINQETTQFQTVVLAYQCSQITNDWITSIFVINIWRYSVRALLFQGILNQLCPIARLSKDSAFFFQQLLYLDALCSFLYTPFQFVYCSCSIITVRVLQVIMTSTTQSCDSCLVCQGDIFVRRLDIKRLS